MSRAIAFELDATSGLVKVSAEDTPGEIERELNRKGYSLSIWPQVEDAPLARFLMGERCLEPYIKGGDIHDCIASLAVRLEDGSLAETFLTPRSAAGPNLRYLLTGTHGAGPKPESVWLRVQAKARQHERRAWRLYRDQAIALLRNQIQDGNRPAVARILPTEPLGIDDLGDGRDTLLLIGFEGDERDVRFRIERSAADAARREAKSLQLWDLPEAFVAADVMPPLYAKAPEDQRPEAVLHWSVLWSRLERCLDELQSRSEGIYPLQATVTGGWHEAALLSLRVLSFEEERDRMLLAKEIDDLLGQAERLQATVLGLRPLQGKIDTHWRRVFTDALTERIARP